jgi:uncharacterized protein YbjT (DUF2867 family)
MRILLTGATGLIGSALAHALLRDGHELVCAVRDPARLALPHDRTRTLQVDLATVPSAQWWQAQLDGVDAVVNAVGILREAPGQLFDALHHQAPAELFRACAAAGVRCVVQVSALGASATAHSRYHRSKHAADDVLRALPVAGAIVQPSLVYSPHGQSTSLFFTLAAAPVLMMPHRGSMEVQPVHLDDVVAAVLAVLRSPPPRVQTIALVGSRPMPLREYLGQLRRQLGWGGGQLMLGLPVALFMAGAAIAGRLPGSALDTETAGMLLEGNAAPAADVTALLGRAPRAVETFIPASRSADLRARTTLALMLPLLRLALAVLWIWTGIVSLGLYPVQGSYELLAAVGLHGTVATVALYGAALLDVLLGVLTLWMPARWRHARRRLWMAQLLLIAGYTAIITIFLPEQWLHPYGPISKNLPIMVAIGLLWWLEPAPRRTPARPH